MSTARILTLVGAGGTGKTRLAMQAAAEMSDRFTDGVWFVELAPLSESGLVPQAVAESMGIREEAGWPILKTLVERLRDRHLLLLIDNCEHVIPAVVQLVDTLLRDCAHLRVLATSRAQLRVNGESIMRVGPLEESDAVTLFAERSASVRPDFQMSAEDAQIAAQICQRVQGIPLAIELAAGRARMMSLSEILAKLQDSFSVLAGGSRSEDARHETLKAAMDWSYRLLDDQEQRLFRRLSVFAGGFTLDAAESVTATVDGSPTLDLLSQLVDKSLVTPRDSGAGPTRYAVLETVREYGRDRLLEEGELLDSQVRHANYFVQLLLSAQPELNAQRRRAWLLRLGDEVDNLRAIFDVTTVPASVKLELAARLDELWDSRAEYSEGRARLEAALKDDAAQSSTRARALRAAGLMAWAQGDQVAAKSYTDQALALSRRLHDRDEEASALQQLGQIAVQLGEFSKARRHLDDALAIATQIGSERTQALCEWRLGMVDLFEKDFKKAGLHIKSGLDMARRQLDDEMIGLSLLMLGYIALWEERVEDARNQLLDSLEALRAHGSTRSIANLLQALAAVAAAEGNTERALRLGGATEALRAKIAVTPSSPFHQELNRRLEALRSQSPGTEAWDSGFQLSRDEAIRYALSAEVRAG
jgi:predicted ATPase